MKYKVYECEERATRNGGTLKKLVLQGEGKSYPDKNVTMWSDHPLYADIAVGQEIDVELEVKDSKTQNPKGGFYKDKTVLKPGVKPVAPPQSSDLGPRVQNMLTFEVIPRLDKILAWQDRAEKYLGMEVEKKKGWDGQMPFEEPADTGSPF